jgi:WD40 repeat protein
VASAGEDQMIRIWDVATKKETLTLRGSEGPILNVRFSSPGLVIAGAKDGTARMWNLADIGHRK